MVEEKYQLPEKKIGSKKEIPEKEYPAIEEIKERLKRLEAYLEKEKVSAEKEKIVKEEIKSYLRELQETPTFASPSTTRDEAEEIQKLEPDQQVGALISLVFEKGLPEAISLAKALGNPAILDEFHDTLVDHYYQMLFERGILKTP